MINCQHYEAGARKLVIESVQLGRQCAAIYEPGAEDIYCHIDMIDMPCLGFDIFITSGQLAKYM